MFDSSRPSVSTVDELVKFIKPITYAFWIFGIQIEIDLNSNGILVDKGEKKSSKNSYSYLKVSYNILCIFLMVFGGIIGCIQLAFQVTHDRFENFITHILKSYTYLNNTVVYVILLRNQEKFSALMSKIIFEIGNFIHRSAESSKYVKHIKRALCLCYAYWLFVTIWKLVHIVYVLLWTPDPVSRQCYEQSKNVFFNSKKMCPYIDALMLLYYSVCIFAFLLSVTTMILMSILLILINVNFDIIKTKTLHITCYNVLDSQLGLFIRDHRLVCDRLLEISKSFRYQIFVWYSFEIVDITLIFRIVTNYQLLTFTRVTYFILLSAVLTSFLTKTFLISSLNFKVRQHIFI